MTDNIQKLRPEDVPPSWNICRNHECPKREECLRYVVAPIVEAARDHGPAVYQSALKNGKCRMFHRLRVIRSAWGFRPLFSNVQHKDYDLLRSEVMYHFGSRSQFFRYNRGDYRLTPEMQEEVFDIFRRHGYDTTNFRFAHYEDTIDFIS